MKSRLGRVISLGILSSLSVFTGWGALAVQAQVNPKQLQAFVEALRLAAPPQQANDGMYSEWQVLPGIIPSWTKQCVGKAMTPTTFESEQAAAKKTITCIAQRELNQRLKVTKNPQLAIRQTACWWMTGKDNGCGKGAAAQYVQRVEKFYQKQK